MRRTRLTALVLAVLIGLALVPAVPAGATSATAADAAPFTARGSVHQVHVIDAPPNTGVELRRRARTVEKARTDDLGGYIFRNVDAGTGYVVVLRTKDRPQSASLTVLGADFVPPQSLYRDQHLEVDNLTATSGYGYLTTRRRDEALGLGRAPGARGQRPVPDGRGVLGL